VCLCGYSELLYIIHKRTKKSAKYYSCLICARTFPVLNSLHQHCKDTGHNLIELIGTYRKQGLSIDEMIKLENTRVLPEGIKRNFVLAHLVKLKANFKCQRCKIHSKSQKENRVEAHHIKLLSKGGKDHSSNMIVLCVDHHKQAHNAEK